MTQTALGRLALSSAAIADVFAWIMLALVLALAGDGYSGFAKIAFGALVLCMAVFGLLKPLFAALMRKHAPDGRPGLMLLAAMLTGAIACAAATEWLGLHAVFGAFLFGACLPRDDRLLRYLSERVEFIAIVLLMPIVFALAGLNTSADAFAGPALWALLSILAVAVLGKLAGGALGARLTGYGWRDSLAAGSLMNARGLMELIVMKVGLDAGLIGPELFTMLLVMAIATTVMTAPLLDRFAGRAAAPVAGHAQRDRA